MLEQNGRPSLRNLDDQLAQLQEELNGEMEKLRIELGTINHMSTEGLGQQIPNGTNSEIEK